MAAITNPKENLTIITIKQKAENGGRCQEVAFWKGQEETWNPFVEQAKVGEFYSFTGLKVRFNGNALSLTASEFTKFVFHPVRAEK